VGPLVPLMCFDAVVLTHLDIVIDVKSCHGRYQVKVRAKIWTGNERRDTPPPAHQRAAAFALNGNDCWMLLYCPSSQTNVKYHVSMFTGCLQLSYLSCQLAVSIMCQPVEIEMRVENHTRPPYAKNDCFNVGHENGVSSSPLRTELSPV